MDCGIYGDTVPHVENAGLTNAAPTARVGVGMNWCPASRPNKLGRGTPTKAMLEVDGRLIGAPSPVPKCEGPGAPAGLIATRDMCLGGRGPVPNGTAVFMGTRYPTLKRGANKRCASGARVGSSLSPRYPRPPSARGRGHPHGGGCLRPGRPACGRIDLTSPKPGDTLPV